MAVNVREELRYGFLNSCIKVCVTVRLYEKAYCSNGSCKGIIKNEVPFNRGSITVGFTPTDLR